MRQHGVPRLLDGVAACRFAESEPPLCLLLLMTYETFAPVASQERLHELVDRFRSNIRQYNSPIYNEENTRADFIDKFFALLGWDMYNTAGGGERYREVVREKSVKVDGQRKAPDYTFRIGEKMMFFVEAKRPSVVIKNDASSAFQLRQYGFSRELPLSILTNFAEFAVYKTRVKIDESDTASTARIFYCRYDEFFNRCKVFPTYETNFDYIDGIFSRQNVFGEKFDDFANSDAIKRGTSPVDKELLVVVEKWRETLAINIAKWNPALDIHHLNAAVQKIIDRILFLRIAEGRGIERHENLFKTINEPGIYHRLQAVFTDADRKYNAGLFERSDWLARLAVDDKVLSPIIKGLYGEKCPYAFEAIPIEILGSIYERFLGKTILLTASHKVKVEDKPEVRKAGGVYYTPQYIVDYIVRQTIGRKIDTTKPIPPLTILDPACGSGSFLIGVYSFLLDALLTYYTSSATILKKSIKNEKIYQIGENDYRLSIEEKRRILLENIYGVDTDELAVEVTKLSLYLKLMENETEESCENLFRYSDLKALPNLDKNIRCGNSLVGSDFYDGKNMTLWGNEEMRTVNAFDWQEAFPAVFKQHKEPGTKRNAVAGFDIVIGNPPYSYMIENDIQEYFQKTYKYQDYQKDLYLMFLEKYAALLKDGGTFGVIVSNTWLQSVTYRKIRAYLTSQYRWHKILHLPDKVFKQAVVDTHVLVFDKIRPAADHRFAVEVYRDATVQPLHELRFSDIPKDGSPINITANPQARQLYDRIVQNCRPLKTLCNVFNGVKPFEKGKGTPPQPAKVMKEKPFVQEGKRPDKDWKPLLRGSLIHRYVNRWNKDYWIHYGQWLAAPRDPAIFEAPEKIMVRQTGDSLIATLIGQGVIARNNLHIIINASNLNLRVYLALINSRLLHFVYEVLNPEKGEALAEVKKTHIEQLPIPVVDLDNKSQRKIHDRLVELVDEMLTAQVGLRESTSELDRKRVSIIDNQIDKAVYELYGLTDDEIRIVEGKFVSKTDGGTLDKQAK